MSTSHWQKFSVKLICRVSCRLGFVFGAGLLKRWSHKELTQGRRSVPRGPSPAPTIERGSLAPLTRLLHRFFDGPKDSNRTVRFLDHSRLIRTDRRGSIGHDFVVSDGQPR